MRTLEPAPILLFKGAVDEEGVPLDLLTADQAVLARGPEAVTHLLSASARLVDVNGWTALPAPAEVHAHLDKALSDPGPGSGDGNLKQALYEMSGIAQGSTDLLEERAARTLRTALANGFTAIRSHVDVGPRCQEHAVSVLSQVAGGFSRVMDIQLFALVWAPSPKAPPTARMATVEQALDQGCYGVGGAPWLDPDPLLAIDELTSIAADLGCPVDLHMDETTDAQILTLVHYAQRVEELGLGGRATASHCVSLGSQSQERAAAVAARLAAVGIAVVTLPQSNLHLQGRDSSCGKLRGMAPLEVLEKAHVLTAAGSDNWRDPFNPMGRIDPLETASLLVSAGHLTPALAYDYTSVRARQVMGLPPARLRAGDQADVLFIRGRGLREAVAGASAERMVVSRGRIAALTRVTTELFT